MSQLKAFVGPETELSRSNINLAPVKPVLSFAQYKAKYGISQGHREPSVYDPSFEQYPDDEWYTLEHDKINSGIHDMCTPILRAVRTHPSNDTEVFNLKTALQRANIVPCGQKFLVAFLGEQGSGKSSLTNAVFNRDLVDVSGGCSACTAFPTIITQKAGACDNTTESDVRVEYHNDDEMRDLSQEQARRYRAAFPRRSRDEPNRDTGDPPNVAREDAPSDDEDDTTFSQSSAPNNDVSQQKGIGLSILQGATNAKSFFNIIFATEGNEERAIALQEDLDYHDIEDGSFADDCVRATRARLRNYNIRSGFGEPDVISDHDLAGFRAVNNKIWPLIKSVRIETGHVLLRNNVGVMDLPGYGDDNNIRTAIIDKFREMANFEIVVTPSSRVASSVVQAKYLNRSINRLGTRNTLLVTNKSDGLFGNIRKHINSVKEAPFPEFKRHLDGIEMVAKQGTEDNSVVRAYRDYLLKEARRCFIEHETDIIKLSLQHQNVDILSVSAKEYSFCLGAEFAEEDNEKPKLTPEATGLPQLRRYLFHVPARTNYLTLHYHVFETLPDIVGHIERILEKFDDDEGYLQMREYLAAQLPQVRTSLEALATSLPNDRVHAPFIENGAKPRIILGLKDMVRNLASPLVYYQSFSKMLKENGIPVNGKALGRNLNQEILNQMVSFINDWHEKMQDQTHDIAMKLDEPIQAVIFDLRKHVLGYDGNPELKHRASELLVTTTRRLGMAHGKMAASLSTKLREIHFLYSNEVNVKCPVALEMKDIYRNVLLQQLAQPGPGSYARQRAHLLECLINPDWPKLPLSEVMEQKIVNAQRGSWRQCCEEYVTEAMTLLQDFARATNELLNNGAHLTSEHHRIRAQLEALLPDFKRQLSQVQNQFPGTDVTHSASPPFKVVSPSNKRKADDGRAATQPPLSKTNEAKRLKALSQPSETGASSALPITQLRENFLSRFEQAPGPVVKREPSP